MIRAGGIAVVALALLVRPAGARADLTIAAPSCERLDITAVERLLAVELADVASEWHALSMPVVLLGCTGQRVRIEITDPITDKSVARTVELAEIDRERVLALAIAQLFLTAWLELLIDDQAGDETSAAARAAERRARDAVERAALASDGAAERDAVEDSAVEDGAASQDAAAEDHAAAGPGISSPMLSTARGAQTETPTPSHEPSSTFRVASEISLEGGLRLRLEGERLPSAATSLRFAVVIDDALLIAVRTTFEWSRAVRGRGTIEILGGALALGVGWRAPTLGPFFVDVVAWAAPVWVHLEGRPSSADVEGGTTQAIAAEGSIELAPSLRVGPVIVALPIAVGGIAFAPEGEVTGEEPVVVGGALFSAMLRISLDLSE